MAAASIHLQHTWSEIMNQVSSNYLSQEQQGKVCFHVLVEKSVSVADLQAAIAALIINRHSPEAYRRTSFVLYEVECQRLAGLFKALISAANVSSPTLKVAKIHQFLETLQSELGEMKKAIIEEIKATPRGCEMNKEVQEETPKGCEMNQEVQEETPKGSCEMNKEVEEETPKGSCEMNKEVEEETPKGCEMNMEIEEKTST